MREVIEKLKADGWKEYIDHSKGGRSFYKAYPSKYAYRPSENKKELQICCTVYELMRIEFELEIVGELKDGTWIKLLNYGLPDNIENVLNKIPRMIKTWEIIRDESSSD